MQRYPTACRGEVYPYSVRIKVLYGPAKKIGNTEGMPIPVLIYTTRKAAEAEYAVAARIHSAIPDASVEVFGPILSRGQVVGYAMENLDGASMYAQFVQIQRTDKELARSEYVATFKSLRRSVNAMNRRLIAHGDIHEGNVISGRLIDPQPYFASGLTRRPLPFLIMRDRSWLKKMAVRVAQLTGVSVSELIAIH